MVELVQPNEITKPSAAQSTDALTKFLQQDCYG